MIPPQTYAMRACITPWVDTRPYAGTVAYSGNSANWAGGVWESWPAALRSGYGLTANPPWGASTSWSSALGGATWNAPSTGQITFPVGADTQQLVYSSSYMRDQGVILPSRPLRNAPTAVDIVDGGTVVTLGGITYRNTHSMRRHWVVDLLMDGPLQENQYTSVLTKWHAFLQRADLGVTIYLDKTNWTVSDLSQGGTYLYAYAGIPNPICGALVDATNVRWSAPSPGISTRYEVTLTIAEVTPPGRSA